MIEVANIVPIKYLKQVDKLNNIEFMLADIALENKTYRNYFKERKNKKLIIMDTPVHENRETIPNEKLVKLAIECCNEIIIPDTFMDMYKTRTNTKEFLDKYYIKLKNHNIKTHAVVQGKNLFEVLTCYNTFLLDKRIDVIGIPFDLEYYSFTSEKRLSKMYNRMLLLQNLQIHFYNTKPIHLLGTHNPLELAFVKHYPFVRSNDSKVAFRCAINNIKINRYSGINTKGNKTFDFNQTLNEKQLRLALLNIRTIIKIENGDK